MTKTHEQGGSEQLGPAFADVLREFLGFDRRLLATVRDLIVHPVRVAREALSGEKDTYLGQVRLFVFLLGLQTVFMVLMQVYDNISVQFILKQPHILQSYQQLMEAKGVGLARIDEDMRNWFNLLITPVSLVHLIIFTVFFKLIAPKITLLGHMLIYMTSNNAATIVGVPLVVLATHLTGNPAISSFIMAPVLFFYIGLFVWTMMRRSVAGGLVKLILALLVYLLATIISALMIWLLLDHMVAAKYGTGPFQFLLQHAVEAARAGAAS